MHVNAHLVVGKHVHAIHLHEDRDGGKKVGRRARAQWPVDAAVAKREEDGLRCLQLRLSQRG